MNRDRYEEMIRDFVIPDLRENGIKGYWFQQDLTSPDIFLWNIFSPKCIQTSHSLFVLPKPTFAECTEYK